LYQWVVPPLPNPLMSLENHSFTGSYLVHLQGKILGPLKGSHIATLVRNGIYPPDVMVQREGEEEVVPFAEINPTAPERPAARESEMPAPLPRVKKVSMKTVLSPPSMPQQERPQRTTAGELPKPALSPPSAVPPVSRKYDRGGAPPKVKRGRPKWVMPLVGVVFAAVVAVAAFLSKDLIHDWWMAGYPDPKMQSQVDGPDAVEDVLLSEASQPKLAPAYLPPANLPAPPSAELVAIYWQENGHVYFVPKAAADLLQIRARLHAQRRAQMMESLRKLAADINEVRRTKPTGDMPSTSELAAYKLRVRRVSDVVIRESAQLRALEKELSNFTAELERTGKKVKVSEAK
jgi:hypothetical protein